ncbi:unnamed protein product [Peronospora destructor]|uniref:Uncharacterized protein n=1 Tax=Peronospora destructor TaxID=86335 RepID=A0AAV0VCB7_9STRA|nr:unnamed protein product [Peronospora destructor]
MSDDILDDMSLSDDEMLDSLADDMLMEMAEDMQQSGAISTSAVPSSWSQRSVSVPSTVTSPVNMPDLGQMMSQMMPLMSQIFSGNAGANPMLGRGASSLQQAPISWQELVKRHVPSNEQEDWLTTIDKDATSSSPMPNVYMEVGTMLANMLNEAVRSAQLEHNRQWQELKDGVVSHLAQTGMTKVFETKVKNMLRQRIANDPDYLVEKDSERYRNITEALSV